MRPDASHRVALVTGASRGLGQAIAQGLSRAGWQVVCASRSAPTEAKYDQSAKTWGLCMDVRSPGSIDAGFRWIDEQFGRLDLLVNNAGVGVFKPVGEFTVEEVDCVLETNVRGPFLVLQRAFACMKGNGGRVINIGSISDYIPLAENSLYSASKGALRALSAAANEEGKHHNIFVTHLSPGAVFTPIWHDRPGFSRDDMLDPEDVSQTVLDIASRPLRVRIDEVKILPRKGVL